MISHELGKELRDADFPYGARATTPGIGEIVITTLSELIAACGEDFSYLAKADDGSEWKCATYSYGRHRVTEAVGSSPEEAVARLWLALHKAV